MTVTGKLVERARAVSFDGLPPDVVIAAKTCLLDWVGCALAGSSEPLVDILIGEVPSDGPATLIGRGASTSVHGAALVNGAASHALDYDDTHLHMAGHPTVPVAPALVALAEERGAAGRDAIAAFVAGIETECRLGAAMGAGHYAVGWHATATMGSFGAAAACAHLLHLDEEQWRHAFGIAGTQAGGLKSVFGSMSKPLHAGKAAANGLLAARLANSGFTSNPELIEAHQGFAATHTTTFTPDAIDALDDRWLIAETLFKYHASCYLTHSAIEAAVEHKVEAGNIASVSVVVPVGHLDVCGISEPRSGLEGKFSLRATVALALLGDDTADPATFTDERISSSDVIALGNKITIEPTPKMIGTATTVDIRTTDGRTQTATADVGRPADDLDRQWERITAKFVRLASPVIGDDRAWTVHETVQRLETTENLATLTAMLR